MSSGASVAKTDVFPNWYVAGPGTKAKILKATEGESLSFVEPFKTEASWKRDIQVICLLCALTFSIVTLVSSPRYVMYYFCISCFAT